MKALVIYDATGYIWNIVYGAEDVPQGIPCLFVDIPEGAQLKCIDVTDKENPKPVFNYLPDSDIGKLQKKIADLKIELINTQLALVEQYEENLALQEEVTNTQLALTELYEGLEVQSDGKCIRRFNPERQKDIGTGAEQD